jgi:hypothetical protein
MAANTTLRARKRRGRPTDAERNFRLVHVADEASWAGFPRTKVYRELEAQTRGALKWDTIRELHEAWVKLGRPGLGRRERDRRYPAEIPRDVLRGARGDLAALRLSECIRLLLRHYDAWLSPLHLTPAHDIAPAVDVAIPRLARR